MTLVDYVRLLHAEAGLYKSRERLEALGSAGPEPPTQAYSDEEVHVMMKVLAHHRHGLPGA
jgi:hypothetical protein